MKIFSNIFKSSCLASLSVNICYMKARYLIMVFFCLLCFDSLGQKISETRVEYTYDANGNRILRKIIVLGKNIPDSIQNFDSTEYLQKVQVNDRKIIVYPNPTKGLITVMIDPYPEQTEAEIIVLNTVGIVLQRKTIIGVSNHIDFSDYPPGLYILHLKLSEENFEWKIIKE